MSLMHLGADAETPAPRPVTGLPNAAGCVAMARDIHSGNILAGWWKQEEREGSGGPQFPSKLVTLPRNIGELLALVHSEISEADEGWAGQFRDDKLPHRQMAEVELADTAIRVFDILGFYEVNNNAFTCDGGMPLPLPTPRDPFGDWVRLMHRYTTRALEGFRKGNADAGVTELAGLLGVLHFAAMAFEFDLMGAIEEKRAFNAVREDHKREVRAAEGGKQF